MMPLSKTCNLSGLYLIQGAAGDFLGRINGSLRFTDDPTNWVSFRRKLSAERFASRMGGVALKAGVVVALNWTVCGNQLQHSIVRVGERRTSRGEAIARAQRELQRALADLEIRRCDLSKSIASTRMAVRRLARLR